MVENVYKVKDTYYFMRGSSLAIWEDKTKKLSMALRRVHCKLGGPVVESYKLIEVASTDELSFLLSRLPPK